MNTELTLNINKEIEIPDTEVEGVDIHPLSFTNIRIREFFTGLVREPILNQHPIDILITFGAMFGAASVGENFNIPAPVAATIGFALKKLIFILPEYGHPLIAEKNPEILTEVMTIHKLSELLKDTTNAIVPKEGRPRPYSLIPYKLDLIKRFTRNFKTTEEAQALFTFF
ncbi:MAG: hypothetical protein HN846_02345 [Candidatus Pacebacteria bacterium]|jgi:hypothetical protein|nr:hypothetical protein [Candidatus Paceibacterota bacterium]MBT3511609.1 hypothetical protein [Candidatus Paceibacterota bacterium]MBT4004698.1 hypothetical protein [Candidatus Paceibacterota bacterium]MBT4359236.1 hypothetical protein [Candidatus Paceibacterota bacterium]MBT4681016.1 hypothetical protein [Candidatus Paceibacterota bacterium]